MAVNNYKEDEAKTKFSWKNLSRMGKYIKPYKKDLVIALILGIMGSIFLLFIPKIINYAIDNYFVTKNFKGIVYLTLLMLGLVGLNIVFTKIRKDKLGKMLYKVANDLKVDIFKKLQVLPNSFYDTRSHGKIYTRASTYPDEASAILCYVFIEIILDIINLILVIIFMLTTNVSLSLISIVLAFILALFFVFLGPIRRRLKHEVNNKNANVNAFVSESINGIRITQSFNRESKNERIISELEEARVKANLKTFYIANLNWSLSGILNYTCMILIYYIGFSYFYPSVTIGTIVAIDSYSSRFWSPIEYLTSSYNEIMDASTYLERMFELLDEDIVIEESNNPKDSLVKGNIKLQNVKFGYTKDKLVLDNFNLEIKEGEKIGLVGVTGSGKSTILNLITRFYDVDDGSILIDGVDIRDMSLKNLRSNVSMMLQDNYLFQRSVYENLVLDKGILMEEVIRVCKMLGIHEMIMGLENGYDTVLYNNASNLSSGERQLLCIARIMLQNPKILILDEATSNIDLKTERMLTKAIDLVVKGRTTIIVAHRLSTIKSCDKIVLVKEHVNYEEGTHLELMAKKGEYYKLYSSQTLG